jgi:hypothetical protein
VNDVPSQSPRSTSRVILPVLVTAVLAGGAGWWLSQESGTDQPLHVSDTTTEDVAHPTPNVVATSGEVTYERMSGPARTVVRDEAGTVVALLTDGARTVVLTGPERTFSEPTSTDATVTTTAWVRLAPRPWKAGAEDDGWFTTWFEAARKDTSPDVFATAFQYVDDAPTIKDKRGRRIAGDASFGPFKANGEGRKESNDFYDYLGVSWSFTDRSRPEQPDPQRYGSLDCSGFVRMVYGYRLGFPLRGTNDPGPGLPRRAFAIAKYGPGVELVPNRGRTATDYNALQPGDLVFFEVEDDIGLDHMGIYLGVDDRGQHRFLSSRDRVNGPTMGDVGGTSVLDDGGFYSTGWRAARRI